MFGVGVLPGNSKVRLRIVDRPASPFCNTSLRFAEGEGSLTRNKFCK
jgi:hypothetical protein